MKKQGKTMTPQKTCDTSITKCKDNEMTEMPDNHQKVCFKNNQWRQMLVHTRNPSYSGG
jgi:hypothetical protein